MNGRVTAGTKGNELSRAGLPRSAVMNRKRSATNAHVATSTTRVPITLRNDLPEAAEVHSVSTAARIAGSTEPAPLPKRTSAAAPETSLGRRLHQVQALARAFYPHWSVWRVFECLRHCILIILIIGSYCKGTLKDKWQVCHLYPPRERLFL